MLTGSETFSKADFMIVEVVGRTLLGQEAALEIDIGRIGPVEESSVSSGIGTDICGRDLFNGVGLLKENELKLLVDYSVKPVAQHVRRIPFRL